jgi:pilus assembly protein CpaF
MTTLHTSDVRNIPDRVVNMMGEGIDPVRMINNIYSNLNVGVLLEKYTDANGNVSRKITQAAVFERIGNQNVCTMLMENGRFDPSAIPESVREKMKKSGITEVCRSKLLEERLSQEKSGRFYGMEAKSEWENPLEYGRAVAEDIEEPW